MQGCLENEYLVSHMQNFDTSPFSYQNRKEKKKQPWKFSGAGVRSRWVEKKLGRVLSYKNQQLILRVFSEILLQLSQSKVKLQLKVVSEVLPPPFCQHPHSACPVMIQFKNLNQNYTSFLLGEDLEPPFWQQQRIVAGLLSHESSSLLRIWSMPGFSPHYIPKSEIINARSPISVLF